MAKETLSRQCEEGWTSEHVMMNTLILMIKGEKLSSEGSSIW